MHAGVEMSGFLPGNARLAVYIPSDTLTWRHLQGVEPCGDHTPGRALASIPQTSKGTLVMIPVNDDPQSVKYRLMTADQAFMLSVTAWRSAPGVVDGLAPLCSPQKSRDVCDFVWAAPCRPSALLDVSAGSAAE